MPKKSDPPKCKFITNHLKTGDNNSLINPDNKEGHNPHSWYSKPFSVVRMYAKLPDEKNNGKMKSTQEYWLCLQCGRPLDNDGNPLYPMGSSIHRENEALVIERSNPYY